MGKKNKKSIKMKPYSDSSDTTSLNMIGIQHLENGKINGIKNDWNFHNKGFLWICSDKKADDLDMAIKKSKF